jgi:hypothetical protein
MLGETDRRSRHGMRQLVVAGAFQSAISQARRGNRWEKPKQQRSDKSEPTKAALEPRQLVADRRPQA